MMIKFLKKCVSVILLGGISVVYGQDSTSLNNLPLRSNNQQIRTIIVDAGHGLPDPGAEGNGYNEADIALGIATKLAQKLRDSLPGVKVLMTRTDRNLPGGLTNKDEANRWRAKFANENHGDLFLCIHVNDAGSVRHSEVVDHETHVYYTGKGKRRKKHTRREPIYRHWTTPSAAIGTETYIWSMEKNDSKTQFIHDNSSSEGEFSDSAMAKDSTTDSLLNTPEAKIAASLKARKFFERSLILASLVQDQFVDQGRVDRGVKQRGTGIWVLQATAMPSILVESGFIQDPNEASYLGSDVGQTAVSDAVFHAVVQYKKILSQRRIN